MLTWSPKASAADAAEDQDAQDLLGRVGRGADRVRAEDRQRLLLRQPLAELLLAGAAGGRRGRRGPARTPAPVASSGRWRPPWRSAGPGRCSGSTARAGARPGRAGRPACGPGAGAVRRSRLRRRRAADRRAAPAGRPRASSPPDGLDVVGDATPGRGPGVGVEDQVARARVAVARLADAARVEQRRGPRRGRRCCRPAARACASGRRPRERDRDVGVAVQPVLGRDRRQAGAGQRPPR